MAILRFSKIRQKFKKNRTDPILGVQVTIVHIHHCAKFGANPLNDVQNFQVKPQKTPKYGYFQTFKNSPKIEKKSDRSNFWCEYVYYVDISLCQIWYESVQR